MVVELSNQSGLGHEIVVLQEPIIVSGECAFTTEGELATVDPRVRAPQLTSSWINVFPPVSSIISFTSLADTDVARTFAVTS